MNTVVSHEDIATGLSYDALVTAFERELGRWEPASGVALAERRAPWSEVEREIERMAGPHGLMIFYRADQGAITSLSGRPKRCSLYLVGNPAIANEIIDIDLRAGFHAPFRVFLYHDGAPDGARIAFDRPSSFLALFARPELDAIGLALDQKIDAVVAALRAPRG
jgi:uncharacterized protein (DUF302 family)